MSKFNNLIRGTKGPCYLLTADRCQRNTKNKAGRGTFDGPRHAPLPMAATWLDASNGGSPGPRHRSLQADGLGNGNCAATLRELASPTEAFSKPWKTDCGPVEPGPNRGSLTGP